MDYFREHNLISSLMALEKETNISLYKFSDEIVFLRNLVMNGQWQDSEVLIKTIFENACGIPANNDGIPQNENDEAQKNENLQYLNNILL